MAFLGVVIAMGIVNLPELDDHWATCAITILPWFLSIFSRYRFKQIARYLHLGNIPSLLNKLFKSLHVPTRNLSVDEQMIGTKSRVAFIQYMPEKQKKFGIKVWALC